MQINELVVGFDSLNKTFEKISISGISKVEQNLASIREQQKLFEESNQQAIKQFADAFAGNYQSLRDDMKLILNTIKHKHSNPVPHVSESDNIFETLFAFENSPVLRFFYKHLFNKS